MLDNLTEEEKSTLKESLSDISRDTPQTTTVATRVKRLIAKAGTPTAEGVKTILVNLATRAATTIIFPPS